MIDFISADRGGIAMYFHNANGKLDFAGWGTTPETLTGLLKKHKVAHTISCASSMDFASEYGFKDDGDANLLWNDVILMYNWEVNGVAG